MAPCSASVPDFSGLGPFGQAAAKLFGSALGVNPVRLALSNRSLGRFPSRFGRTDLGPSCRAHSALEAFRCRPHDERNIPVARSLTGLDQFGRVPIHK
jgi:hypothetical protein